MSAEPVERSSDPMRHHRGRWTERQFLALGADTEQRTELLDGSLLMSPIGDGHHQKIGARLWAQLERQLTGTYDAVHEGNVRLRPGRIIIPDVVVTSVPFDETTIAAEHVVLVAEVESPSTRSVDRALKPTLCAEAGIPWFLRVERRPRVRLVLAARVDSRSYEETCHALAGERLEIPDLGWVLDVDGLLRRMD